ncbi:MAG TPA: DUF6519 domain-containing protein [Bryobacteraceae bacterium]|jgi:hypothetical protein
MGSDRARISYDRKQEYRSVVMQQGRVTVEADWNEAQLLASEETREEALDFVGPAGTPDNGYAITLPTSGFDFEIGAGTMYVGGVRAHLPKAEKYSQQTDWLDAAIDPDWVSVPAKAPSNNEYVYLLLREQEVSGVEDSDLKDVALGGPDTAQRTRLIQHVERLGTTGTDCPSALAAAEKVWITQGFAFEASDMRVRPFGRLEVGFVPTGVATPCDPAAQGGYLGADNQLIRVQISSTGKGGLKLLWGYDDASFLYRVTVDDPQTLTLQAAPVDAEHIPQGGQAVEVLMDAAQLSNGQFVAAPVGEVFTLGTSPYDTDSRKLTLPSALDADYGDGTKKNPGPAQVYLRIWQQELTFTAGTAVTLGDTGAQVTLTSEKNQPFRVGDYWMFAVRPGTPQQVYPERYQAAPQPPDGPREWICPLAVILWTATPVTVSSCTNPFDNLVNLTKRKLGGCCTVSVSPSDLASGKSLQTIVDQYIGTAGVNVCFAPGTYDMDGPLVLGSSHSHFHFEACAGAVILRASPNAAGNAASTFLQGLVVLNSATDVSFEGIQFQLPLVPVSSSTLTAVGAAGSSIVFSIGIRPVNSTDIRVENCEFEFRRANASLLAIGILAGGDSIGLQLEGNKFEMPAATNRLTEFLPNIRSATSVTVGFSLFPTVVSSAARSESLLASGVAAQVVPSELQQASIRNNTFTGLTLCSLVYADVGLVGVESNTARSCTWGFWFLTLPALAYAENAADIATAAPYSAEIQDLMTHLSTALRNASIQFAAGMLRGFPLPAAVDLSKAISVTVRKPATTIKDAVMLQATLDRLPAAAADSVTTTPAEGEAAALAGENIVISTPASGLATLNQNFDIVEKQAFPVRANAAIPLALHMADNDISTAGTGAQAGLELLVWDLGTNDQDAVTLTGNSFIDGGALPVVLIGGVSRCTCTGNMVLNEGAGTGRPSLWLYPVAVTDSANSKLKVFAAAVTGNVFRGVARLPARNVIPAPPAPMNTWHFFNAET